MLVGVGGSGKQSLTRLAAFTAGCEVFEITLIRGYSEEKFREDLKGLYQKLGIENKKIVFLFTDSHIAEESKLFFYKAAYGKFLHLNFKEEFSNPLRQRIMLH